jgi:hypothetical protein
MDKICISNLVYGQPYIDIFLNFHIKSLLENFSEEEFCQRPIYLIFTGEEGLPVIQSHENFSKLKHKFDIQFIKLEGALLHNLRYQLQTSQMQWTVKFALEHKLLVHMASADIYYGKNFFKNALIHIKAGYDSVICPPIRVTFESASSYLLGPELSVDELFEVGFNNLHPLWVASNWESPLFCALPYQILWSDEKSICLRGFSVSPMLFYAQEWMSNMGGCIDLTLSPHFKKPYFCIEWSELPVIELCQILHFYPPFKNKKANIQDVANWAKVHADPANYSMLSKYTIIKKINDPINEELIFKSKLITDVIMTTLKF